jgi:hypothetical protein
LEEPPSVATSRLASHATATQPDSSATSSARESTFVGAAQRCGGFKAWTANAVSHLSQRFVFPCRKRHDESAAKALTDGRKAALFGIEQLRAAQRLDLPGLFADSFYIAHAPTDSGLLGVTLLPSRPSERPQARPDRYQLPQDRRAPRRPASAPPEARRVRPLARRPP